MITNHHNPAADPARPAAPLCSAPTGTVGLFVPCYIDQFYPQVAIATLQLLERLGCRVEVPAGQTCCGQPMANSGFEAITAPCSDLFVRNFDRYDYIVSPSGSCVLHAKHHVSGPGAPPGFFDGRIFELTEFLTDVLQVQSLPARFAHRVGLHQSCHGQRGLHLSQMSERVAPPFSKPAALLNLVRDLELVPLDRPDECCGFGGTFCVAEEAVSVKMGRDRVADHVANTVEVLTGGDMSCLMHLAGIISREHSFLQSGGRLGEPSLPGILSRGRSPMRVMHIAEILNAGWPA